MTFLPGRLRVRRQELGVDRAEPVDPLGRAQDRLVQASNELAIAKQAEDLPASLTSLRTDVQQFTAGLLAPKTRIEAELNLIDAENNAPANSGR